jgi:AraC-like DNA-binding protein
MDTLSEVLRGVRLTGAVFLRGELSAPWCVGMPPANAIARFLMPSAEHLTNYHLVTNGRCTVKPEGSAPIALEAGDVIILPHGESHLIGSDLHLAPADLHALTQPPGWERLPLVRYGGGGETAEIACGFLACDPRLCRPILTALPAAVKVNIRSTPTGAWIENSIRYALDQAMSPRPGSDALLAKLSEVLFVDTLRSYMDSLPPERTGWLAGLRDSLVGASLALMHAHPARAWTVEKLAREVGASRTVLADRFTHFIGEPPMHYLARWRLAVAADLLRSGRTTLMRVAESVGYQSETAFNHAFKREHGVSPARWRRRGGAEPQPPTHVSPRTA